jgi:hypothetical protein
MPGPFNYLVYRDQFSSGSYHAIRVRDGVEIKSHATDAAPVIQAALDQPFLGDPNPHNFGPGDVYISAAVYELGASMPGLLLRSNTRVTLDPTAILEVASGYVGPVVLLQADQTAGALLEANWDGGIIREAKPEQRQWTAFKLRSNPSGDLSTTAGFGVMFNKISNTRVLGGLIGIAMYATGNAHSFVNANKLEFLKFYQPQIAIDFQVFSGYQLGEESGGILYNHFVDLQFEASHDPSTFTAGIRGVSGVHNQFTGIGLWDAPTSPVLTIGPLADRTLVVGGMLAGEAGAIGDGGRATKVV